MSEPVEEHGEARAVALTTARLERLLQQTRKDEARLKRILEVRRLKRRLSVATPVRAVPDPHAGAATGGRT